MLRSHGRHSVSLPASNYSSWLEQKEARLETENKQIDAHMKAMKQELEWVRSNPKARQAKSKSRIARFEEMSSQEYQKRNETQEIFIPVGAVHASHQPHQRICAHPHRSPDAAFHP